MKLSNANPIVAATPQRCLRLSWPTHPVDRALWAIAGMMVLAALLAMVVLLMVADARSDQAVLHSQTLPSVVGGSWVASAPGESGPTTLPYYVIEPPDVLLIDVCKLVPQGSYHLRTGDEIRIWISDSQEDRPIAARYRVDSEGLVDLGMEYGRVKVDRLTVDEVEYTIESHLRGRLSPSEVSVSLGRIAGQQQITGEHPVEPDGTINLGTYGSVYLAGLTIAEAKLAVEDQLKDYFDAPRVSVDGCVLNSNVYYVITRTSGMADTVTRLPLTGNDTVLDALAQINGLSRLSSKSVWIARPLSGDGKGEQILPVDWTAITSRMATAGNYSLLPGDRIFVVCSRLKELRETIHEFLSPNERIFGLDLLGNAQRARTHNRFLLPSGFY